jgi:putative acetyltransferase
VSSHDGSIDWTIRPIRPDDDPAIAAIIGKVMPEFGAGGAGFAIHDPEVAHMSQAYQGGGAAYFVVELNGTVMGGAGIAALEGADDGTCELRKMYFLPPLRGRGAAQALIERCLAFARESGYARCYIETLTGMDAAQALYARNGFRRTDSALGATGHFGCDRYYLLDLRD